MSTVARIQPNPLSEIKSGKASAAQMLTEAFENLSARTVKAIGPNGQPMGMPVAWPRGQSPSDEERTALTRIVKSIHAAMQVPATEDEMENELELLFSSRSLYGADIAGKTRVYSLVLADVPRAILQTAVAQIIRGKADGIGKDLPGTDVLLAYCERLQRDVMAKAVMIERMLALPEQAPPEPELSEEHRQAMREKIALLARPKRTEGSDV